MHWLYQISALFLVFVVTFSLIIDVFLMEECRNFKIDSQESKTFIVTGANSGLGFHTALDLAKAGGNVVLAVRTLEKGETAKNLILEVAPNAIVDVIQLDLSKLSSVKSFVSTFTKKYKTFDVLINNAGIMALPKREVTIDGFEAQIGTNHFGHFALTAQLYPFLKNDGRIVVHSSDAHNLMKTNFVTEDLQCEDYSFWGWTAYGNSKAANLMFTYELNKRLQAAGNPKGIKVIAVHPGYTGTNLQTGAIPFADQVNNLVAMKGEHGSQSQTLAAVGNGVSSSFRNFIGPRFLMFGAPRVLSTNPATWDDVQMVTLWEKSELLTKTSFKF